MKALEAVLAPLGYKIHRWTVPTITEQYLVLSSPGYGDAVEDSICGTGDDLDVPLRVTAVAGTPDGAVIMLNRVRALLSPGRDETRVPAEGLDVRVRFTRSEVVDVDRDVTITGTNRHPAYGVDTYRLVSQPV